MKIIDCFIFYNEIDLLKYRIDVYNDAVDYFIIVESKYTHSGNEKELYYENNKTNEIFERNKDKIIHIVLDNLPYLYPNIDYTKNEQWINEHYQRNCIIKGINVIKDKLLEDDIIIISDLDEFPDYFFLKEVKQNNVLLDTNTAYTLKQDMYYYNLNTLLDDDWYHSKLLSYKLFNYIIHNNFSITNIRIGIKGLDYKIIDKCGWHLSYFGDIHFIKNKLRYFAHQEFNNEKYTDIKNIKNKIDNQINLFDTKKLKNIPINQNSYLPYKYNEYLSKYIVN